MSDTPETDRSKREARTFAPRTLVVRVNVVENIERGIRAMAKELLALARAYGRHEGSCPVIRSVPSMRGPCDCGFESALWHYEDALAKNPNPLSDRTAAKSDEGLSPATAPTQPASGLGPVLEVTHQHQSEIRLNDDKTLDEVVGHNCTAHLEQLDDDHWFLTIGDVGIWLHAPKGRINASYERRSVASELQPNVTRTGLQR